MNRKVLTVILLGLAGLLLLPQSGTAQETIVYVELSSPKPTVVAKWEAKQAGALFDAELHRASVRLAQDSFLKELTAAGVGYTVLSTTMVVGGGETSVPNRYTELINAVRLSVVGEDVGRIRSNPKVKQVSVEEPRVLLLDNSVPYVRANGPDSARSRGFRGTGTALPDGSASGQVVAVLDTGIDHTNPMFDSQFSDEEFEQRNADIRPVRIAGTPYTPGVNHPKVIYRALFSTAHVEGDDNGHGTHSSSTAAGLKARTDTGEVVEGVAPGAALMDYKICPSLLCLEELILASLEDSVKERDPAGFPKPKATVVNMSFGDCSGNPEAADGVAAGNLQFAGVVPVASAGNRDTVRQALCGSGVENTIGSPAAARRVVAVGATVDPGTGLWSGDVLDPAGVDRNMTGAVTPAEDLAAAAGERTGIRLFPMAGTPPPPREGMAQYYVFVLGGETPASWPANARGRIGIVRSTMPATFAQIANSGASAGAVAVLLRSTVQSPTAITAPIPGANVLPEEFDYLVRILSSSDNDNPATGALSELPVRLSSKSPEFDPAPAGFSSYGPNNDFAVVKPDTTAPGVNILMGTARVDNPNGFASNSGTSFSGPHVAGAAALVRDPNVGRPDFSSSQVRAALMNSATNLREADGVTAVPDDDARNFIHAVGAGLIEMVRATSVKAVLGTNELNGGGGPDNPQHPDFLPSFSFGERPVIGTNLPASAAFQQARVTVTVADVSGAGGSYTLSVVDAGALRGDVTRPLTEPGFSLSLNQSSVFVPANGRATFDVGVAVDGTANGLQIAGRDDTGEFMGDILLGMGPGAEATEFLWYVVATRTDGSESLRMPFYYRAVRGVEGGGVVGVASGGGWIASGNGKDHFSFQAEGTTPATGEIVFKPATGPTLTGSVGTVSVNGNGASFSGSCTLEDGTACEYTAEVEDNGNPGRGADRFTIRWTTADGGSFESSGLLGAGNIQVRTR